MDSPAPALSPLPLIAHRRSATDRQLRRELRIDLLRRNSFEFLIALAAVLAVPIILLSVHGVKGSAIGHLAVWLAPFWLALFGAGGLFILIGLLKLSPRAEIVGLTFYIAAAITNGVADLIASGGSGAAGGMTFLMIGMAAFWRARQVWKVTQIAVHRTGEHGR